MRRAIEWIAAGLLTCGGVALAAEAPTPTNVQELDRALAKIFVAGEIPGASVALVEDGQITFTKGYGLADVARRVPATADTPFRAGSIAKSVTAIALMTLVEQGKLSLDTRVVEAAPEVPFVNPWEAKHPLRLVHLLEHTSGWPDIGTRVLSKDEPGWSTLAGARFASPDFVSRWEPGRFMVYCNAGAGVVGVAIERASGRSFDDYAREAVLRPLGMRSADFALTPELVRQIAKSYSGAGAQTPYQHIVVRPAGSLNISAHELAQLVRFFLGRGTVDGRVILSPASISRIERSETNLAAAAGFTQGYGLGNAPLPDKGVTFRGHNGSIDSFTAVMAYSRRANSGYVLMANGGAGVDFASPAAQAIQRYLTRRLALAPPPTVTLKKSVLARYAGFYRNVTPPNRFLRPYIETLGWARVTLADSTLRRGGHVLMPVSAQLFRRDDREDASLAFVEDGGRIYAVTAFNAAMQEPAWKPLLALAGAALLVLGALVGVVMLVPWLVAAARGRLAARGGLLVRLLPFVGVAALVVTFLVPILLFTSSPTSARPLATVGPWSLAVCAASLLVPICSLSGLALAWRRASAGRFVRATAAATSLGLLAASTYMAAIGWLGARTWLM